MQKENNKKTKVILVFGGVYSSLGKGVAVSSIAKILKKIYLEQKRCTLCTS